MVRTKIKPQAAAFKVWQAFGHLHPSEVDLEDLAFLRGVLVKPGGISGATGRLTRMGDNGIIRYNKNITQPGRVRFTIAHELGHWELHKEESQFLMCTESDMRDYGKSPLEIEANLFAAELLMPPKHFRPRVAALKPSIESVEILAKEFRTTITATAIRLAETSKKNLQVVWAENGNIKWSYKKQDSPHLRVNKGPLPNYCSANLPKSDVADYMEHYDQAQWFPHFDNTYEVMEQTVRIPQLNATLSLLEIN